MLTSDTMKYASREWLRDRQDAIEDRDGFTTTETTNLELTSEQGYGNESKDGWRIETSPIDVKTEQKDADVRDGKTKGGR